MSVLDLSSLLQLTAPEVLAPPDPPATPAIDTSTASTADSTSSSSAGSSDDSYTLDTALSPRETADAALFGASTAATTTVNPYETAAEEAAAALVDIGGASDVTVDDYESSVPPNLAAASALLSELTANSNANTGELSAAYLALNSDDALSLTAA